MKAKLLIILSIMAIAYVYIDLSCTAILHERQEAIRVSNEVKEALGCTEDSTCGCAYCAD